MEGRQGSTVCLTIERQEAPDIIGHRNLKRLVRLERKYSQSQFALSQLSVFEFPLCLAFYSVRELVVQD
jgi:hypothetical protein